MEEGATGQTFSRVYRVVVHGKRKFFILPQGLKGTLRGGNKQGATNEKYSIRCDVTKSNQRITLLLLSIYSVKVDLMMIPAKA
jgi:hypothetical protein